MTKIKYILFTIVSILYSMTICADTIASGSCGDNLMWNISNDSTLTISGSGDMHDYLAYGNDTPWRYLKEKIKSVVIGDSVTHIGNSAFCECKNITSLTIGKSVRSIGDFAFMYCYGLPYLIIPNSVTTINLNAFCRCKGLTSVTLGNSVKHIGEDAFQDDDNIKELIYAEGIDTIVRSGITSIPSITIPNTVTTLADSAFYNCNQLLSITIPASVTHIGKYAFFYCDNVKELIYAEGTTNVLPTDLTSASSVILPNSVTNIEEYAFLDFNMLDTITLPNSLTRIRGGVFQGCNNLSTFEIPNSVTTIDDFAISGSKLTTIILGNSVKNVYRNSFNGCSNVKKLIYAEGTKKAIRTYLKSASYVGMPNSLTTIADSAFYDFEQLWKLTIPKSVTHIGHLALYTGSKGLKKLICEAQTPATIDYYDYEIPFGYNGYIAKVYVPEKSLSAYKSSKVWKDYISDIFAIEDGVEDTITCGSVYNRGNGKTYYWNVSDDYTLTITGDGYTDYAEPLAPSTPETRPWDDFYDKIKKVIVENGISIVGPYTFMNLINCTTVILNNTGPIDEKAFKGCMNVKKLIYGNNKTIANATYLTTVTSITIPNTVTTIEKEAFLDFSRIKSITIPSSVSCIEKNAFYGCVRLTEMVCEAVSPPSVSYPYTFDPVSKEEGSTLFVPSESLEDYRTAKYWKEWYNIQPIPALASGSCGDNLVWNISNDSTLTISGSGEMDDAPDPYKLHWGKYYPKIKNVIIEDDVTGIGDYNFYCCFNIETMTIGSSVTHIGQGAFMGCSGLTTMICKAIVPPTLSQEVFYKVINCTLYVPAQSVAAYKKANQWRDLDNILPIETDGIHSSITSSRTVEYYKINGVRIPHPTHTGVYVIRENGQSRKAFIKK